MDDARTIEELQAALAKSRAETRAAFENRAYMYAYIYEELLKVMGRDAAIDLMKRAIYRRGLEVGRKYASAAEKADLVESAASSARVPPLRAASSSRASRKPPKVTSCCA